MTPEKDIVNEQQLALLLSANMARIPHVDDPKLFRSTREVAEDFLDCTPRMVNEYVLAYGLRQAGRDLFYLPDVVNWRSVKMVADLMGRKPQDLKVWGVIDFGLGEGHLLEMKVPKENRVAGPILGVTSPRMDKPKAKQRAKKTK
jgi:hypothetical protein